MTDTPTAAIPRRWRLRCLDDHAAHHVSEWLTGLDGRRNSLGVTLDGPTVEFGTTREAVARSVAQYAIGRGWAAPDATAEKFAAPVTPEER